MLGGFVLNDSNCLDLDWRLNGGKLHGKHQLIKGEKPRTNWSLQVHNLCPHLTAMQGQNHYKKKLHVFFGYGWPPPKRRRYVFFFLVPTWTTKCCKFIQPSTPLRRKPPEPRRFSQDVQWRYSRPRESQLAPWTKNPQIVRGRWKGTTWSPRFVV